MRDDLVYLRDISDSIVLIKSYVEGKTSKDFDDDTALQDAVVRRLEIIGEAAKRISETRRQECPDIPWKQIAGMRDILIHEYAGISVETVWNTTMKDLDDLAACVNQMIGKGVSTRV